MANDPSFQSVVEALLDTTKPFPANYLHYFSDLDPANLDILLAAWPDITSQRKQNLLEDLEDLMDSDTLTSFEDLGRSLISDPDPVVRTLAIHLLSECDDPKLALKYLECLQKDESPLVRTASADALGWLIYLGEIDKIPGHVHRQVEDILLTTFQSENSELVKQHVLEALGASSRTEVEPLIRAALGQKNPAWVVSALNAIGRSSNEEWDKEILSHLRSKKDVIRKAAINSAGEVGIPSAREPLLTLLEEEEEIETRHEIVTALSKIGGEGVRSRLEELVESEEDDEEVEFLEEALNSLIFSEEMGNFKMFDFDDDNDRDHED